MKMKLAHVAEYPAPTQCRLISIQYNGAEWWAAYTPINHWTIHTPGPKAMQVTAPRPTLLRALTELKILCRVSA